MRAVNPPAIGQQVGVQPRASIVLVGAMDDAFAGWSKPLCAEAADCVCVDNAEALFRHLAATSDRPPDAVIIDRAQPSALAIARTLAEHSTRTLAIFLLAATHVPAFRWAVALNPALGTPLIVDADRGSTGLVDTVRQAIASFRRDLAMRDAVDQINRGVERRAAVAMAQVRRERATDRYLANLLAQIPDPVISTDMEGAIVSWNQAATALFEVTSASLLGQRLVDLVPAQTRATMEALLQTARRERETQHEELLFSAGTVRSFDVLVTRTVDERGRPEALLVIMRDVSAQKAALAELEVQTKELARSNADLEQFAYVASHDLKEPLRTITSYSQLLLRRYSGQLDADADEFIEYVVDGAHRMHRLIGDLLNYSRAGGHKLDVQPTPLEDVIRQAISNISLSVSESHAKIDFEAMPTLRVDKGQMVQVFQNLFSNAIKFRADAAPHISVRAERNQGFWKLTVADNGIGIEREYLQYIFVAFKRLHPEDRYPGSGIGLAICKKILERHGGTIWAESQPGQGSTFFLTLPD